MQTSANKKIPVLTFFLIVFLSAFGQQDPDEIQAAFKEYNDHSLIEKIFTHTDKDFYLVGELMWFKLYVVSGNDNKPLDVSKVAYVEIIDKGQKPVLQSKIALNDGKGNGSFYLPVSLSSGVYKLRAYTSWMKNFSADYFFEKTITIVNSLKNLNAPAKPSKKYDIQFFPEGGDLVQGIQSKVAFKIVDQSGKEVRCLGFVVNKNNDTVARFQPFKFGIGSFMFTPQTGNEYKAIVETADTVFTAEFPTALEQGYVLKLTGTNQAQLSITVTTNIKNAGVVYLFAHTRQVSKLADEATLTNGIAEFTIDKNKLGEGVSHITVFNENKQPVCERLLFIQPTHKLSIQPTIEWQQFALRQKIKLNVNSADETQKPVAADISVSVYKLDSLQSMQDITIENYFWLTSELRGSIESPGYYFSEKNAGVDEATDNLMLTHGWRRFTWQNVLQHVRPDYSFVPEYKGHIIYGKVTNIKTGSPAANVVAYLSVPGPRVQLYSARSDSSGNISFYTKDLYGPNEVVLQAGDKGDSIYKIELNSPFFDKFSSTTVPFFNLSPALKNLVTDYNVGMQVQNDFSGDKLKQYYPPVIDSAAFFGKPDVQYLLDNYTRFSTMEEVLREYVYEVLVRRQKENFHFIVSDVDNKIFLDDPFTLINGVPVFDPNKIIKYDPLKVKKIDIVKRKYFYGPLIMNGIVNFITYQPDPELNPSALEYEGMQYQREFYSPVYETQEQVSSRLPDFRNVLYWAPDVKTDTQGKAEINFYTSDIKGKYVAILQGMNADGKVGQKFISFEVK